LEQNVSDVPAHQIIPTSRARLFCILLRHDQCPPRKVIDQARPFVYTFLAFYWHGSVLVILNKAEKGLDNHGNGLIIGKTPAAFYLCALFNKRSSPKLARRVRGRTLD
jgi:hypothetical protein